MAFPYNDRDQLITEQGILGGAADVSGGAGFFRVSTINTIAVTAISANQSLSAVLLAGTANIGYVSAFVDNGSISARSGDANQVHVSAVQGDAALFRVSSLNQDANFMHVSGFSPDAALFRISSIGGSLSLSGDAAGNRVSAVQEGAGALMVSAKSNDGALLRTSAVQDGAAALNVSAKSNDGALFRVSAILAAGVSSVGAASFGVSAAQNDAGALHTSAYSGDANQQHVSAVQGDAALLRVSTIGTLTVSAHEVKQSDAASLLTSAKSGDGNQFHVSSVQGDAALLRVSALQSAPTTGTGGSSFFSTSAGIAVASAVKGSTGRLYGWYLFNRAGTPQYLQIFDASATTSIALGTTVPGMRFPVPSNDAYMAGALTGPQGPGIGFSNGIVIGVTSTPDGSTAGASAMVVNLFYA